MANIRKIIQNTGVFNFSKNNIDIQLQCQNKYFLIFWICLFFFIPYRADLLAQRMQTYEKILELGSNNLCTFYINSKNEVILIHDNKIKRVEDFINFEFGKNNIFNDIGAGVMNKDKVICPVIKGFVYVYENDQIQKVAIKGQKVLGFLPNVPETDLFFINDKNEVFQFDVDNYTQHKKLFDIPCDINILFSNCVGHECLYKDKSTGEYKLFLLKKELECWTFKDNQCKLLYKIDKSEYLNFFRSDDDRGIIYRDKIGYFSFNNEGKKYYIRKESQLPSYKTMNKLASMDNNSFYLNYTENKINTTYEIDKKTLELKQTYTFPASNYVIKVKKDRFNTLWAITSSSFIRVYPYIFLYDNNDHRTLQNISTIVEDKKHRVWIGNYGSGICYVENGRFYKTFGDLEKYKKVLNVNKVDEQGNIYFSVDDEKYKSIKTNISNQVKPYLDFKPSSFFKDKEGNTIMTTYDKGCVIQRKDGTFQNLSENGYPYTTAGVLNQDDDGNYWIAKGNKGLVYYDVKKDKMYVWGDDNGFINLKIRSSLKDKYGNIWFGSAKDTLYFHQKNDVVDANFIPSDRFKKIYINNTGIINNLTFYKNNLLVLGEKKSCILDLDKYYKSNYQVQVLYDLDGVKAEKSAWMIDENQILWSGISSYLSKTNLNGIILDSLPPNVRVDSIKVGELKFDGTNSNLTLDVKQHTLNLFYSIDYAPYYLNNVRMYYRLNNNEKRLLSSSNRMLELSYLSPTTHSLEIIAVKNGVEYLIRRINIDVKPEIWKNTWFFAFLLGLMSLFLWSIYKLRIDKQAVSLQQKQNEVEKIKQEQTLLKSQVLINQLNPHYLNNVMQMIQVYLFPKMEAIQIIDKLTSNIDLIFRNSIKNKVYHTIEEEMNIVSNYLFIQQKRFNNDLIYKLPDKEEMNRLGGYDLFLMNIQIHVENAIEHGIRNKEGGGYVEVFLKEKRSYIDIIIEDNGVGRKYAQQIGSKGTQKGTTILNDLMNMFNLANKIKMKSVYEDDIFEDENGNKHGTRVTLFLPKEYNFELIESNGK